MLPYRVLALYKPSEWCARTVGHELTQLTAQMGFTPHDDPVHGPLSLKGRNWSSMLLHAEVRRRTFNTSQAESFHYDGDLEPGSKPDCAIILWASNHPTQIKWRDDSHIYQPNPYEVVIFHNLQCLHRRPPDVPKIRWVFRQRVTTPKPE